MRKRTWTAGIAVLMLLLMCCTPALALEESEVESAIAASSNEAVAGNIFIWFLCAVAFLKISQKISTLHHRETSLIMCRKWVVQLVIIVLLA